MNREGLKSLDRAIANLERQLATLSEQLEHLRGTRAFFEAHPEYVEPDVTASTAVRDTIEQILIAAGGDSLHYRQIHDELIKRGVRVGGEDPGRTVGAHLSGDMRFESLGGGMWTLRRWVKRPRPEPQSEQTPSKNSRHSLVS